MGIGEGDILGTSWYPGILCIKGLSGTGEGIVLGHPSYLGVLSILGLSGRDYGVVGKVCFVWDSQKQPRIDCVIIGHI